MKKIAIIGATGMLGQPVAKEFIKSGFDVSLLVRDMQKAKETFGDNPRYFTGDLKDKNSLSEFLTGQDALYLNLSVAQKSSRKDFQPEREGIDNILEATKNSAVKRIGYLSSLIQFYQGQNGYHWWAFDIKQEAIAKIKNSGIAYSIFYPSAFMESFDKGAYRQGDMIALAGTSRYKLYLIAGSDYGKQVVKAFELNNGNNEYIIQGQEGFTADEAGRFYVENYKAKKVKLVKAPLGVLRFLGYFSNKFNYGAKVIEAINNYPEKFEAEKTWQELGKPETTFLEYINKA